MNLIKVLKILLFCTVSLIIILYCGCGKDDDNPVNPVEKFTIAGRVTDYWGKEIPNLRVELNSQIKTVSSDGSFAFSDVRLPYDITVYEYYGNVVTFRGLNTISPVLPIDHSGIPQQYNANITVIFPPFNNNQTAYLVFYNDSGMHHSYKKIYSSTYGVINHQWSGNPTVKGKVAVWICTDSTYSVISYDKYGEKSLTISNGGAERIVFYDNDLGTNPTDTTISGLLTIPQNFSVNFFRIGMNRYPFANIFEYGFSITNAEINNMNFSAFIPLLQGDIYKYYAWIRIIHQDNFRMGIKVTEILPKYFNNINFNTFPSLISPENNEQNVDYGTIFSFSKDSPQGIYAAKLDYPGNGIYVDRSIYMNTETFTLTQLTDTNYNIPENALCHWFITKIIGYKNTDEFVSTPPGINTKFKEELRTEQRTFRTKLTNKK
ncbi:MAG: hypothetical protein JW917_02830 [Ignavibacteria bacterium]|nr:hypothetical protein [Ignavibacteria bacterium]